MSDRLIQIQKQLKRLREEYNATENKMNTTLNAADEQKCQHQLEDLSPKISAYEREYEQEEDRWQVFVNEAVITETQADAVIAEILEGVTAIESQQFAGLPDEALQLLQEIRDAVKQPDASVPKLKVALSLAPPFLSASSEFAVDRKKLIKEWFPTFTGGYQQLAGAFAKK